MHGERGREDGEGGSIGCGEHWGKVDSGRGEESMGKGQHGLW
jgi:hypothetical protein